MFYTAEFWEMFLSNYAIRRSWQKHLGFVLSTSIKTRDQCRCGVCSCLCKSHNKPLDYEISITNIMQVYNKLYTVRHTVEIASKLSVHSLAPRVAHARYTQS